MSDPLTTPTSNAFGVYVHVPFCASKCEYCAFATWTDRHHLIERYLEAVRIEIDRAVAAGLPPATSVFVGGGTPSLVPSRLLGDVIRSIPVVDGAEVTVECNPDDVTSSLVDDLLRAGVDRFSLGVQSTSSHVLSSLGRMHDRAHVRRAVAAVRDGGARSFNLDLIFGAVGESIEDWRRSVEEVLALDPPHVAAYGLTPEPGTPLAADVERHPDDDDQADKYLLADELLTTAGLQNYEVSNWARPGHESVHNRLYWAQGDYLGVGCAAHSHRAGRRSWNVRTPDRYIDLITAGTSPESSAESLDEATARWERRQLALRTADGVERDAFEPDALDDLEGFVEPHPSAPERIVLTRRGRLLANEIAMRLSDAANPDPVTGEGVGVVLGAANVRRR